MILKDEQRQRAARRLAERELRSRVHRPHMVGEIRAQRQMELDCRVADRAKLDPEWHEVLVRAAARDGKDIGEYVERIVMKSLKKLLRDHSLDKEHFGDLLVSGQKQSRTGKIN